MKRFYILKDGTMQSGHPRKPPAVPFGGNACFVHGSLVVLVIASTMPFEYTRVTIKRKENNTMAQTKNLCAQVPIDLHQKISEAREQAGLTTAQYITNLITEYFKMKENGGNEIMTNGKTRTLAFQIDEELFQRIKDHLDRESARLGRKFTQKEFVLGLIEQALAESEANANAQASPNTAPVSPSEAPDEPDEGEGQAEDKGQR